MIRMTRGAMAAMLVVGLATGCGSAESTSPSGDATTDVAAGRTADATERLEVSDFSVYDLGSVWRDGTDTPRELASLGGRVQVVAMVYTYCGHTCPLILAELKRIEGALSPAERGRVGFTLVSMDPARDTPARLAEYAAQTRLDPARWTLLTAGEEEVRDLAALLGIRYREEEGGEYSHSNTYLVLDGRGHVVGRQVGLGGPPEASLARIRAALGAER